jgi:hypothetical protein
MNVTKIIRVNANLLAWFKIANSETVLESVFSLFIEFVKEEQFEELYETATKEPLYTLVLVVNHHLKRISTKFSNLS